MKIKIHNLTVFSVVAASAVLLGAVGNARAADEWFVMGEQTLNSADSSAEIKSQGGRWKKDVKQVRLSVEGADVQILKVVLGWDNRPDDDAQRGRNRKGRRTDGSDGCSGTQRAPHIGRRSSTRSSVRHRRPQSRSWDSIDRGVTADQSTSAIS